MENTAEERSLQYKLKEYNELFESRNSIISTLKEEHDRSDVMSQINLKKQIDKYEEERDQLVEKMTEIEIELNNIKNEREKKELIQEANKNELAHSYEIAIEKWRRIYDLDPENSNAVNQISRLEGKLQRDTQLDGYISELLVRLQEIEPVYREVLARLRNMKDTDQDDKIMLSMVEKFLQQETSADNFMKAWEAWKEAEKKPTTMAAVEQPNYAILAERLQRGEVVLFLGSDIPQLSGITELQLESLVEKLANKIDYKDFSGSLSTIAQYYEMSDYGRSSLVRNLNEILKEIDISDIKIYNLLSKIDRPLVIISSAYDMFLENYFHKANKKYILISSSLYDKRGCNIAGSIVDIKRGNVIIHYSDKPEITLLESGQDLSNLKWIQDYSLIYKIRGYCENYGQDDWILTEENYFEFARHIGNLIPDYILTQFMNRLVFFIGYSAKHWEDRLLAGLILELAQYESSKVVPRPADSFEVAYWRWKKADRYPVDLESFVAGLEAHLP